MQRMLVYASVLIPALIAMAGLVMWKLQRRAVPVEAPAMVRTASLSALPDRGRGWWFGLLSTMVPIAGVASLLAMRWQTIPQRFPIHWDAALQPNGWAYRSAGSVFGPLVLTFALVLVMGLIGELIARSSPGHDGRAAMIGTMRIILVAASWFATLLFCSISLLPLSRHPTNLVPLVVMGSMVSSLVLIVYVLYRATRLTREIAAGRNSTDPRFWKGGVFYFNAGDSALMVPKREGFGYTLNFGRPVCWVILGLIVLLPMILPLAMHFSRRP